MIDKRLHYYVEGQCEKKLINEFKKQQTLILPGKVDVFNPVHELLTEIRLRLLPEQCTVALVFDTDIPNVAILKENLDILKRHRRVRKTLCVLQVHNLEDELRRATDVKDIRELLGDRNIQDFKGEFIAEKNLFGKLKQHHFDMDKFWVTEPDGVYAFLGKNDGNAIKQQERRARNR